MESTRKQQEKRKSPKSLYVNRITNQNDKLKKNIRNRNIKIITFEDKDKISRAFSLEMHLNDTKQSALIERKRRTKNERKNDKQMKTNQNLKQMAQKLAKQNAIKNTVLKTSMKHYQLLPDDIKKDYYPCSLPMYELGDLFDYKQQPLYKVQKSPTFSRKITLNQNDEEKQKIVQLEEKYPSLKNNTVFVKKSLVDMIEKGKKYDVSEEIVICVVMKDGGNVDVKNIGRRCAKFNKQIEEREEEVFEEMKVKYEKRKESRHVGEMMYNYKSFSNYLQSSECDYKQLELLQKQMFTFHPTMKTLPDIEQFNQQKKQNENNSEDPMKEMFDQMMSIKKKQIDEMKEKEREFLNKEKYVDLFTQCEKAIIIVSKDDIVDKDQFDIKKQLKRYFDSSSLSLDEIQKEYGCSYDLTISEKVCDAFAPKGEIKSILQEFPENTFDICEKGVKYGNELIKTSKKEEKPELLTMNIVEEVKKKVAILFITHYSYAEQWRKIENIMNVESITITSIKSFKNIARSTGNFVSSYIFGSTKEKLYGKERRRNRTYYYDRWYDLKLLHKCYVGANKITTQQFSEMKEKMNDLLKWNFHNENDIERRTAYIDSNEVIDAMIKLWNYDDLCVMKDNNTMLQHIGEVRNEMVQRKLEEMDKEINEKVEFESDEDDDESEEDSDYSDISE